MKITLIKPAIGDAIKGYNINDGSMEPLALAIIAGLIGDKHQVVFYDDRVESIDFEHETDLVAINAETFTARRTYQIADEFRKRSRKVVIGGMHATLLPDEVGHHADSVVVGDAEQVWHELMLDLEEGRLKPLYIGKPGIPQEGVFPDRSIFNGKKYLPVSLVQFSRGCKFNCSFCSVSKFFENNHNCRKIDDVIAEIERNKLKTILFVDDNMVSNKTALKDFLRELAPLKVKWASQSSIDMIKDRELMKLMADSGCVGNLIGFESINVNTLKWFNKSHNIQGFNTYKDVLDAFRDYGFLTWASFMVGNDFDTIDTIERTVEFAIKSKFTLAFFHILMPYPGTKIYEQFKEEGRLLYDGKWWDHPDYKYNTATYIPKLMSPEKLSGATIKANKDFYTSSSIFKRMLDFKTNMRNPVNFMVYSKFNSVLKKTSV